MHYPVQDSSCPVYFIVLICLVVTDGDALYMWNEGTGWTSISGSTLSMTIVHGRFFH